MGKANNSRLRRGFGVDDYGQIDLPNRYSNVKLSRIEHCKDRGGCGLCYPHGFETTNATTKKNNRSWKRQRKTKYKV